MRIVVCVKQVYDPRTVRVSQSRQSLDLRNAELVLNPPDLLAMEEALRLREAAGGEVVVLTLGKPEADDVLLWSVAMGADAAYLLTDEKFAEADVGVTAKVLAAAMRKLGDVDAAFLGAYAADSEAGQMGARLSALLGWSFLPSVTDVFKTGSNLAGLSQLQSPARRLLGALPAVVTVHPRATRPRFPHAARVINAYRDAKVVVWDADDLGLAEDELAPQTEFRSYSLLPERERGNMIEGSVEEMARSLAGELYRRRLLDREA